MQDEFTEESGTVTVPCPDPECSEIHDISTMDKPESLVNNCNECNKKYGFIGI